MTREQINAHIQDLMAEPVEFKEVNDTLYIKFDFLPYVIREFVHSQKDYDANRMINVDRECQCGKAYFLDAAHFYNIMSRYELPKK